MYPEWIKVGRRWIRRETILAIKDEVVLVRVEFVDGSTDSFEGEEAVAMRTYLANQLENGRAVDVMRLAAETPRETLCGLAG